LVFCSPLQILLGTPSGLLFWIHPTGIVAPVALAVWISILFYQSRKLPTKHPSGLLVSGFLVSTYIFWLYPFIQNLVAPGTFLEGDQAPSIFERNSPKAERLIHQPTLRTQKIQRKKHGEWAFECNYAATRARIIEGHWLL